MKETSYKEINPTQTKSDSLETNHVDNSHIEVALHIRTMQFLFALTGIYFCYLYYGIMQEYMCEIFLFI